MIKGEAQGDHLADGHFIFDDGRFGLDAADAEDGAFGRIQNRGECVDIHGAQTGEGKGAAGYVVKGEGTFVRPGYGVPESDREFDELHPFGVLNVRDGETAFEIDGQPDVDVGQQDDLVALKAGVHVGMFA